MQKYQDELNKAGEAFQNKEYSDAFDILYRCFSKNAENLTASEYLKLIGFIFYVLNYKTDYWESKIRSDQNEIRRDLQITRQEMGRELLKFQGKIPSIEAIINSLTEMDKKIETLSNNGIISQSVSSAVSLLETRFLEFKEDTINNLYTISSDQSELYKLFNLGDHINHLSVELQRKDQWINDLEQRISHLENLISGQSEIRNSGYSSEYTPELTKTVPHSNNLTNQYAAPKDYTASSAYRKKESGEHSHSNSPLITRYIASAEGGRMSKKNFLNDCIYLKVRNLESILTSRNEQMPLFEEDSDGIFITPRGFSDSLEILPLFDISPNDSNSFQILGLAFNISGSGNNFTLAETALAIKGNGKTYSLKKKGQLIIRD